MKIKIDGKIYEIESFDEEIFYGEDKVLSNVESDINWHQNWYQKGYEISDLLNKKQFEDIVNKIKLFINKIANKEFDLEKYHRHISEEKHYEIVKITRDLFTENLNFCIKNELEKKIGFQLTDIDSFSGNKVHIIVRINRPNSNDYNPPHKDIYEYYDEYNIIQKCINFWIPICGVSEKSMLPLAPSSHLIPENKILRSKKGAIINKKQYRVRNIYEWDKSIELIRPNIKYGQVLTFTPNLIHGAAINEQIDATRIALEFRLFKK